MAYFNSKQERFDFFAVQAPNEIPRWFVSQHAERPAPPHFPLTPEHQKEVEYWLHDKRFDLPEELKHVQKAYADWEEQCRKHTLACEEERFFQWRMYFAKMMVAECWLDPLLSLK